MLENLKTDLLILITEKKKPAKNYSIKTISSLQNCCNLEKSLTDLPNRQVFVVSLSSSLKAKCCVKAFDQL